MANCTFIKSQTDDTSGDREQKLKELVEQYVENRLLEFNLRLAIIELKRSALGMD